VAEQMTGLHIFDVVRQPTHAPTVLLPWLFTAATSTSPPTGSA